MEGPETGAAENTRQAEGARGSPDPRGGRWSGGRAGQRPAPQPPAASVSVTATQTQHVRPALTFTRLFAFFHSSHFITCSDSRSRLRNLTKTGRDGCFYALVSRRRSGHRTRRAESARGPDARGAGRGGRGRGETGTRRARVPRGPGRSPPDARVAIGRAPDARGHRALSKPAGAAAAPTSRRRREERGARRGLRHANHGHRERGPSPLRPGKSAGARGRLPTTSRRHVPAPNPPQIPAPPLSVRLGSGGLLTNPCNFYNHWTISCYGDFF